MCGLRTATSAPSDSRIVEKLPFGFLDFSQLICKKTTRVLIVQAFQKENITETKYLQHGLKIFFYQLALSTAPAATNGPTGNLYVTSRGIFTPSYTENVLIKVVVQQKDILGVISMHTIFSFLTKPIGQIYEM